MASFVLLIVLMDYMEIMQVDFVLVLRVVL